MNLPLCKEYGGAAGRARVPDASSIDEAHNLLFVAELSHSLQLGSFDCEFVHLKNVLLDLLHRVWWHIQLEVPCSKRV